jgi:hypothetical protein
LRGGDENYIDLVRQAVGRQFAAHNALFLLSSCCIAVCGGRFLFFSLFSLIVLPEGETFPLLVKSFLVGQIVIL